MYFEVVSGVSDTLSLSIRPPVSFHQRLKGSSTQLGQGNYFVMDLLVKSGNCKARCYDGVILLNVVYSWLIV